MAFSLYGPQRTDAYMVNLHPREDARFGPALEAHIGRNHARWDGARYVVQLDDELLDRRSINGTIEMTPLRELTPTSESDGDHRWIAAAPRCRFTARLNVGGESISLSGLGYHDHNRGRGSLQSQFQRWEWGRAHFSDETIIYYRSTSLDGATSGRVLRVRDGVDVSPLHFETTGDSRNLYALRYPSRARIEGRDGASSVTLEQTRVIDNGPFYLRFLSEFEKEGQRVVGFSEVLEPKALEWRWFWPLLDSRVRRVNSGDRVGRAITNWLVRKGF